MEGDGHGSKWRASERERRGGGGCERGCEETAPSPQERRKKTGADENFLTTKSRKEKKCTYVCVDDVVQRHDVRVRRLSEHADLVGDALERLDVLDSALVDDFHGKIDLRQEIELRKRESVCFKS